ncbi:hypothetical protein SAMN05660484_01809 [Eubacterium ruminantium]|uniref:Uncharacterized protein n=1 Tax=Eubacterium ruminantium TaxID=42322 RepID=A0A1T4P136_9FIRM|nr:hypothetical protein [Eubacterium ruminantium]SCW57030.1 hypothetical protein SAMN05660484_01809 [Eubacterium ruminantium]SDN07737.1 hypothetical protein SAMN04490370_109121 [Eubacterium ruminantium]SJZ85330.1 hypothetical protein SAMN02745110_01810 [Eubacterium ruminantium]
MINKAFPIGKKVMVVSEDEIGTVVGYEGDFIKVQFAPDIILEFFEHELFYAEES